MKISMQWVKYSIYHCSFYTIVNFLEMTSEVYLLLQHKHVICLTMQLGIRYSELNCGNEYYQVVVFYYVVYKEL